MPHHKDYSGRLSLYKKVKTFDNKKTLLTHSMNNTITWNSEPLNKALPGLFEDVLFRHYGMSKLNDAEYKIVDIFCETIVTNNSSDKPYSKDLLLKKIRLDFKIEGLPVVGAKCNMSVDRYGNIKQQNLSAPLWEKTKEEIEIMNEEEVKKHVLNKYFIDKDISKLETKLCYYVSENSDLIIPVYKVGGMTQNKNNLLEFFVPANLKYEPKLSYDSIIVENMNLITKILPDDQIAVNDVDNTTTDSTTYNYPAVEFDLKLLNVKNINRSIHNKLNIIVGGKVIGLSNSNDTFDINDNSDVSVKCELPIDLYKYNDQINADSSYVPTVNYMICLENEFGFMDLGKLNKLPLPIATPPSPPTTTVGGKSNINPKTASRDQNTDHGGNRLNYGIEWGEKDLGALIYSRAINKFSNHLHQEYAWDGFNSWEKDFKDFDNNEGLDDYFVDNVDMSLYVGHGNGDGFTFETSIDDTKLTYLDAAGGNAWGDRDLEFQAWLSCQVLEEMNSGLTWWERWGPTFNGLHLICGFQTNANVGTNNMFKFFGENLYDNSSTVRNSWFQAADDDQPDDNEAVVMGPLTLNTDTNAYNSIESSIPGYYRAYWNDHMWNVGSGPGTDLPKSEVVGFWRIVYTV